MGLPGDLAFLLVSINLFLRRVGLLVLSYTAGEDDEACLVGFQAFNIEDKGFGGEIGTARINGDTDGRSVLLWDSSFLYVEV